LNYHDAHLRILIRAAMTRRGVTQAALAERIGMTKQELCRWLRCENTRRSIGERAALELGIRHKGQ
jgi:transcriptional regulator with XRE-family HTH domain